MNLSKITSQKKVFEYAVSLAVNELNYILNELVELPDYSDCEIFPEFCVSHKKLDFSGPSTEIISHCCKQGFNYL